MRRGDGAGRGPGRNSIRKLFATVVLLSRMASPPHRCVAAEPSDPVVPEAPPSPPSSRRFPDAPTVLDMAVLSNAVYHLRTKVESCHDARAGNGTRIEDDASEDAEEVFRLLLPEGTECLHYSHDRSLGTQVLVVRSTVRNYVAVAYAGTDDWNTALLDGQILTSDFGPGIDGPLPAEEVGPIFGSVPEGVRVHRGFNAAVFDSESYRVVMDCVASARRGGDCGGNHDGDDVGSGAGSDDSGDGGSSEPYRILTTGHSLGAADAVLLGQTLRLTYPDETIRSINFGCPKMGNAEWSFWTNSMQPGAGDVGRDEDGGGGSFEVFRFVNKVDLIPRLPEITFFHAGHTLQMSAGGDVKAYYDHVGNEDLGYAGVPFGWDAAPFALLPFAIDSHFSSHYVNYLSEYLSVSSNATEVNGYVDGFEREEIPPPPETSYG